MTRCAGDGFAVDREEFDENFCCIAAPIFDERGRFVAALGLSTTAHVFDAERSSSRRRSSTWPRGAVADAAQRAGASGQRGVARDSWLGLVNCKQIAKNRRFLPGHSGRT